MRQWFRPFITVLEQNGNPSKDIKRVINASNFESAADFEDKILQGIEFEYGLRIPFSRIEEEEIIRQTTNPANLNDDSFARHFKNLKTLKYS